MSIPKINTDLTLKETLSKCGYCAVGSYFWMKEADQEIGAEPQWIKKFRLPPPANGSAKSHSMKFEGQNPGLYLLCTYILEEWEVS